MDEVDERIEELVEEGCLTPYVSDGETYYALNPIFEVLHPGLYEEFMKMANQEVNEVITRLISMGLIQVAAVGEDGKSLYELTPAGEMYVKELNAD